MNMKIPIIRHSFDEADRENLLKPLESGWLVQGPYVAEFERMFCQFTGAKYAKATTSCTTALHLALVALGIGPGDKVIVPSFTYVASANAVEYTGAEVVLCDIDLRTYNIDVERVRDILENDKGRRIKAVMPVNLFGLSADLVTIKELAEEYGIAVIEDSACGIGASIRGKHSGTFGAVGCFSFHPRKVITTGEGGMLITDDENIASKVSSLRDHGAEKSDLARHKDKSGSLLPDFNDRGYNYRMTDIQGALGVAQMRKAENIIKGRGLVAGRYNESLAGIDKLNIPYVPEGYIHGFQSYVCIYSGGEDINNLTMEKIVKLNRERNLLMEKLEEKGISTRQGTHAVHTLGYYKKKFVFSEMDYPVSFACDRLSITLPLYSDMSDEEFNYVITNITERLA
ncbi:MAG: DegT/DnrJ/EryC1/StrS aminotransferase family protein [Candidatus Omnitrophica bacterium]|nr:DegT/DnrJ/EryC1/StrS aminotransferase family protein [Candidatus Omnitrophota bacterium]